MTLLILDYDTRNIIYLFSNFTSFIWTERFKDVGDFEIKMLLTKKNIEIFSLGRYIKIPDSDELMIIETISIDSEGNELTITGRTFASVLYRRIWHSWNPDIDTKTPTNTIVDCFSKVIDESFIKSTGNPNGKVDYINYDISNIDRPSNNIINSLKHYPQLGDNIGEYVYSIATIYNIGIHTKFDQNTKYITFSLYDGKKKENVIFGKSKYNLSNSRLVRSNKELKTTALIAGEGEGDTRKTITITKTFNIYDVNNNIVSSNVEYKGLKQREEFVDANDVQLQEGETAEDYTKRLKAKGQESLFNHNETQTMDGKILNTGKYKLNIDYGLGDIVTIKDNYFMAEVKIIEIVRSWSSANGYEIYPSFEVLSITNATEVMEINNIS